MIRLILLGVLSGAFFSSTFILNEVMSVSGGHWLWSASLRYFFMILFLALILLICAYSCFACNYFLFFFKF